MALTKRMKAGYGAAEFGLAGAELLLQLYLLEYYVRGVGLNPWLAGAALALATLWDAVTDPVMGGIVDRTRSRFGRFVPYLLGGGFLFGFALVALFNAPASDSQVFLFLYLLFIYMVVNTGLTIIGVPHIALGGALSPDTHERTELYGWRLIFGTAGLFAGILAPLAAAKWLGVDVGNAAGIVTSRGWGSVLMGSAVVVTAVITVVAVYRRARDLAAGGEPFRWADLWHNFGRVLANKAFVPFFMAFLLVAMGRTLNATLALPYYKDGLRLKESAVQGPILSVFTLCIVLSVPMWVWLGRRFGKRDPAFWGLLVLGVMTVVAYPLFPEGSVMGPVGAAVLGGLAVGAIILVESLVTDIADADWVESGEEREGVYFGFWRMGQKVARSVTLGLTGLMLGLIGYEESLAVQTESTRRGLAYLFGFGVGGLFVAAALVFRLTPISRERQEQIQAKKVKMEKEGTQ